MFFFVFEKMKCHSPAGCVFNKVKTIVKLTSLWSENVEGFGLLNRLSSAGNVDLLVDALQVPFDSVIRNEQFFGNLLVLQTPRSWSLFR